MFSTTFKQEQLEQKSLISFFTKEIIVVKISCRLNSIFLHKISKKQSKEASTTVVSLS